MSETLGDYLQDKYDAWLEELQRLTSKVLDPSDWTGRWYDGYSPAEALEDGPDDDADPQ